MQEEDLQEGLTILLIRKLRKSIRAKWLTKMN
jgi:hypothetical protein